jgi:hypothetical protein
MNSQLTNNPYPLNKKFSPSALFLEFLGQAGPSKPWGSKFIESGIPRSWKPQLQGSPSVSEGGTHLCAELTASLERFQATVTLGKGLEEIDHNVRIAKGIRPKLASWLKRFPGLWWSYHAYSLQDGHWTWSFSYRDKKNIDGTFSVWIFQSPGKKATLLARVVESGRGIQN